MCAASWAPHVRIASHDCALRRSSQFCGVGDGPTIGKRPPFFGLPKLLDGEQVDRGWCTSAVSAETTISQTSTFNRYPIRQVKIVHPAFELLAHLKRPVELSNWLVVEIVADFSTKSLGVLDRPARLRCTACCIAPSLSIALPAKCGISLDSAIQDRITEV